ncbi:hypothetical protein [Paenibacillus sp. GCM10028914]|uniref:hypothetical protein n=1 Tax=Paenibacillus sp. GCM10028914 TaxID=3273416 RepID=UPI003608C814
MKKHKLLVVILTICVCSVLFFLKMSGYSFSKEGALKYSVPYDGDIVYEQNFSNHTLVILKGKQETYAKLIKSKWNVLFQVTNVSVLGPLYPDETNLRTWSAHLNSNKRYDTILAIEVSDPRFRKVIITNEKIDNEKSTDVEEIKENSNIFIELNIVNGYAGTFQELDSKDAGGFVFRAIDDTGSIKYLGR